MARSISNIVLAGVVALLLSTLTGQAQFLGCYKDRSDRDISARHWSSGSMTVGKCVADCRSRGFRYAGVQYFTHCFCGNSYGRFGRANNCTAKCGGNKSQICGGTWANSVYATGASGGGTGKQAFCQRYSNTAISQQRQNLSRQCGFRGGRWQLNYNNHYNWCMHTSSSNADSETNARNNQLRNCGGGSGGKQAFCQRYSNTAISQQRQNLSRQCGFRGGRWQLNYNNHYNWCMHTSSSNADSETNARNDQLRNCGGGSGGKQTFCRQYTNTAISQQRQNVSRRCGFRGARWQVNYNNHYNWCMRVSRGNANGETNARTNQLRQCRPAQSRLFKSRWDKIAGPGAPWTTGWVRNQTQQVCGHQHAGCRCGAGYCGNYRSGATTYWWPNGCQGPRWTILCTSEPQ